MPIYVGTNNFKIYDDTATGSNYKMQFSGNQDHMVQRRCGGVAVNGSYTVFDHFEGWACYVGYGGGGYAGTIVCGEDRTDFTVTTSGVATGYSLSKSGSQGALVVNAGDNYAIANISFSGFVMRF